MHINLMLYSCKQCVINVNNSLAIWGNHSIISMMHQNSARLNAFWAIILMEVRGRHGGNSEERGERGATQLIVSTVYLHLLIRNLHVFPVYRWLMKHMHMQVASWLSDTKYTY